MKRIFVLFVCFLFSYSVNAGDLEELYKSPDVKQLSAEKFVSKYSNFKWQGANKRVAISKNSFLFKRKVREAIAYFNADGKLTRLDSWVYNRGDDGDMVQVKFEAEYEKLIAELTEYFGIRKAQRKPVDGAARAEAYSFMMANRHEVKLLVGFDKKPRYRADFLNLVLRNYSDIDRLRGSAASKFIKKEKSGDVLIDRIPMIDQGPKGYCVPATLARIGQHFGVDISMHEIAMISDSSSGGGTYVHLAMDSLKKNYGRIKMRIKDIKFKNPFNIYVRRGNTLYPNSPNAAKNAAMQIEDDDRDVKNFFKAVKKQIDKGYIVAWSMVVGLLPENGAPVRQGGGGHMRMIIGYNEKTQEILFSDSWGKGHEFKRIPVKSAMIVSSGLYEIVP